MNKRRLGHRDPCESVIAIRQLPSTFTCHSLYVACFELLV